MWLVLAATLVGDPGPCLRPDYPAHFVTQPYEVVDSIQFIGAHPDSAASYVYARLGLIAPMSIVCSESYADGGSLDLCIEDSDGNSVSFMWVNPMREYRSGVGFIGPPRFLRETDPILVGSDREYAFLLAFRFCQLDDRLGKTAERIADRLETQRNACSFESTGGN